LIPVKAPVAHGFLFSLLCLALCATMPAAAQQTLYENGPINGETDAWTINFGFAIADSFAISTGNSTVTGMSFGAWLNPGDILESVEVTLTSEPFGGTVFFDGVVNVVQSNCFVDNYGFDVCTETGRFSGPTLQNGTYWITLQNGIVNNGDPVYWDENSGIGCQSPGCPSTGTEDATGTIPSEAFTILGAPATSTTTTTSTTPEPDSVLLLGSGLLAVAGVLRRKLS
jgi:hypothetical protein